MANQAELLDDDSEEFLDSDIDLLIEAARKIKFENEEYV